MAPSNAFLNGTIMFSGISPDFSTALKDELFGCFRYIHIPYSELMTMPVRDRKQYIKMHNEATKEENGNKNHTMQLEGKIASDVMADMFINGNAGQ